MKEAERFKKIGIKAPKGTLAQHDCESSCSY